MSKAAGKFPSNPDVNLEYGKTLVENERAFEAVRPLEAAVKANNQDWASYSAYGVALDQIGEHDLARQQYTNALSLSPNNRQVLNNMGLSYALDGKLTDARYTLRQAIGQSGGDARMRQNLALVLAIGGELNEAERLARSDLPPQTASKNIAFFRSLLNQPAYWDEFTPDNVERPSFTPAPAAPKATPKKAPTPLLKENLPRSQHLMARLLCADQPLARQRRRPMIKAFR